MHVSRTVTVAAEPSEVMAVLKGPEGWADWHPSIRAVEPAGFEAVELLRVVFEDGGAVIEQPLGSDGNSFGYAIVGGQATMTRYQGTVTVIEAGAGSVVVWNVNFEPLTAGTYEAIAEGFVEVGLQALAERFS